MGDMKTIFFVTGASSGVGQAIVEYFAQDENNVIYASARRAHRLRELADRFPCVKVLPLDVSDSAAVQEAIATIESGSGPINVLVNNASLSLTCSLEEMGSVP